jgi:type I restriction enzyme M protein
MITGDLKHQIDRVWETFWTGGLSNPLTVIEQMTYLLFIRRLDELQINKEQAANLLNRPIADPIYTPEQYELRWSRFKDTDPEAMYRLFTRDGGVFEFLRQMGGRDSAFSRFMKGATFMIPSPRLLAMVVEMLSHVNMQDRDTKGDVYEYLLSKIATSGQNGQFRTPRHIIKMMVDMVQPSPDDVICDPSAGTAGFLVEAGEYIRTHHADALLRQEVRQRMEQECFMGMEFDPTMIRIGAMNLMLHGIEHPRLHDVDALSDANADFTGVATIILANPPFKGSLDQQAVDKRIIQLVDSKKTELLFLGLILRGLQLGGRAAVIVPDGVLFGSSKAHQQIRQRLIDEHQLTAVVSMPSGVFKPYAGVSTAILFFTKTGTGGTDHVWFYDMHSDGFSLDDKRQPITNNDIPDIVARYHARDQEHTRLRTDRSFMVPAQEIKDQKYDLSINRYKEVVYAQKIYAAPATIIAEIEALDAERASLLNHLKTLLV